MDVGRKEGEKVEMSGRMKKDQHTLSRIELGVFVHDSTKEWEREKAAMHRAWFGAS